MRSLLRKELNSFFSSVTGYLVVIVFLLLNSSFMWIFRGGFNLLDRGYASLDSLFGLAPWIFLFLVPAITMRMFSEEKRSGTLELLLTRPASEWNIVLSKFFAAWILLVISLLPTLVYFFSVYKLGSPPGNLDTGGTWGSYTGLIFLGGIYASVGIFSSSLTDNQIISFVVSVILCFLLYLGFDLISTVILEGNSSFFVKKLGIDFHYQSIARGVIDSRDLFYFIAVMFIFLYSTRFVIMKRKG